MTNELDNNDNFLPLLRKLADNNLRPNIYTETISLPLHSTMQNHDVDVSFFGAGNGAKVFLNASENISILSSLNKHIEKLEEHATFLYSYRSIRVVFEYLLKNGKLADQEKEIAESEFVKVYTEKMKPKILIIRDIVEEWDAADNFLISLGSKAIYEDAHSEHVIFEKMMRLIDGLFSVEYTKFIRTPIPIDISYFFRQQSTESEGKKIQMLYSSSNIDHRNEQKKKNMNSPKAKAFFLSYFDWIMKEYEKINKPGQDSLVNYQKKYSIANSVYYLMKSIDNFHEVLKGRKKQREDVISLFRDVPHVPVQFDVYYSPSIYVNSLLGVAEEPQKKIILESEEIRRRYGEVLDILSKCKKGYSVVFLIRIHNFLSYVAFSLRQLVTAQLVAGINLGQTGDDAKKLDDNELNFMVECIAYMKIVMSEVVPKAANIFGTCISKVHKDIQQFIKNEIDHPLFHAIKAKNETVRNSIEVLMSMFGSFDRSTNKFRLEMYKNTKEIPAEVIDGFGAMSSNQLDIFRILLTSITLNKDLEKKRIFRDKHIGQINQLLEKVNADYYVFLDYVNVIKKITNVGYMYFREYPLSMKKNEGKLFFEIQTSIPHVLCEYITKSSSPFTFDYMFFPFEIYNDAANIATYKFEFFPYYKEIQREGQICVSMVATFLSQELMKYYISVAAYMELPGEINSDFLPDSRRFELLFGMNSLSIAGKEFNFSALLTKYINLYLKEKLAGVLGYFYEFRYATYASYLIRVIKSVHRMFRLNHVQVDDFNIIWNEVNDFKFPSKLSTTLSEYMKSAISFKNMRLSIITKRYTIRGNDSMQRSILDIPDSIHDLFVADVRYVGLEHIRALVDIMQQSELSLLISNIEKKFKNLFLRFKREYYDIVQAISVIAPQQTDDISTLYNFFYDAYDSIADNEHFVPLIDVMSSIGNLLAFLWFLDNELVLILNRSNDLRNKTVMMNVLSVAKSFADSEQSIINEDTVDVRNFSRHRTFASLWSVIEFLFVTRRRGPSSGAGSESESHNDKRGDGAILLAHVLINLCNQTAIYNYDSIVQRLIRISHVKNDEKNQPGVKELLMLCSVCEQCKLYSEIITRAYVDQTN